MTNRVYHTITFQQSLPNQLRNERLIYTEPSNTNRSHSTKFHSIGKAVTKFHQVLRYIEKSGPYIEKYGPLIKEVPTMYQLMKVFNDIESESESSSIHKKDNTSQPKLYI